jgi:hypothetical protein
MTDKKPAVARQLPLLPLSACKGRKTKRRKGSETSKKGGK